MARGPKGNLENVSALPLHAEPQAVDFARAADLRPVDLTAEERLYWDRLAPHLSLLGRLQPTYVDYFAEHCRVLAHMADLRVYLRANGRTYTSETRNGTQVKQRPEVGQYNEAWRQMRSMVGSFGLAPAEDRALKGMTQGDMFGDEFDAL